MDVPREASHHPRTFLRVLLATGQRPGEVQNMEWSELSAGLWTIPGEKQGASPAEIRGTKNGLPHLVPLAPAVERRIQELRMLTGKGRYVFAGMKIGRPLSLPNRLYQRSVRSVKFHWTLHDLRRTTSTHLQRLGVSSDVIDRTQNHLEAGVRRNYNMWEYIEERKEALSLWAVELGRLSRGAFQ